VRACGVSARVAANDPEGKARFAAFEQGLQQLGWVDGRNVRIEIRWSGGKSDGFYSGGIWDGSKMARAA